MMFITKRVVSAVVIMVMAMSLVLALPMTALGGEGQVNEGTYEGVYEGEYGLGGKRSGYGTWTYHNYLYVGQWENDLPNGEGTLYAHDAQEHGGKKFITKHIIKGTWVDGLAEGMIEESYIHDPSEVMTLCYELKNGRATQSEVQSADGAHSISMPIGFLIGAVPPWNGTDAWADASVPPPSSSYGFDSDLIAPEMIYVPQAPMSFDEILAEGTYEGEYDANGKRSGQGTWTYHNYLYVGHWENDMPNGEGTLYVGYEADSDGNPTEVIVTQATWTDGLADGAILWSRYNSNGEMRVFSFDVERGRGTMNRWAAGITRNGEEIVTTEGTPAFSIEGGALYAGVPPWAQLADFNNGSDQYIDYECTSPLPSAVSLPSWTDTALIAENQTKLFGAATDGYEGTYEGEYDLDGKRSGYGTWAYYNYLYVGNWKDDMPNGEGTLYSCWYIERDDKTNEITNLHGRITHGNWVDGRGSGTVEYSDLADETVHVYCIEGVSNKSVRLVPALNLRGVCTYYATETQGTVPLGEGWEVNPEVDTPWYLYEKYPTGRIDYTPLEKLENTGMGMTPGNLANASRAGYEQFEQMALLGDWIFLSERVNGTDKDGGTNVVYKMRADGTQMIKLFEYKYDPETFSPAFQRAGDWLYLSNYRFVDIGAYKMKADDVEFTVEEGGHIPGLVVDEWFYQADTGGSVYRFALDGSKVERLGTFDIDNRLQDSWQSVIFVDEDWVYLFTGNDWYELSQKRRVNQFTKIKKDGSGETEIYVFREGIGALSYYPQIVGSRMYFMQTDQGALSTTSSLYSVDLHFSETPVKLPLPNVEWPVVAFHVTEDFIYYASVKNLRDRHKISTIARANHDGSNPQVLAEGIQGRIYDILIAGDWMVFNTEDLAYLMRLDGSDLHKLSEPFVPHDAPGITDSTGKWRYELLDDGSAMILGAGSKLKQSGKLAIPATVDKIPVTAIGENAFYGCEDFTSVTIPKSVTTIGNFAFFWCKGLTSVTIPEGVTSIGEGAFQWCSKLKKVSLPVSLASVGKQAFAHCPVVELTVAKNNETFHIVDGALFDKVQNQVVE